MFLEQKRLKDLPCRRHIIPESYSLEQKILFEITAEEGMLKNMMGHRLSYELITFSLIIINLFFLLFSYFLSVFLLSNLERSFCIKVKKILYNLGENIVDQFTKLTKILFSTECLRVYFFQFSCATVKICLLVGQLATDIYTYIYIYIHFTDMTKY